MNIEPNTRVEPFIEVSAAPKPSERHPGRRGATQIAESSVAAASTAEVADLKRSWVEGVPGESFSRWVVDTPDEVFLKWVRAVEEDFRDGCLRAALKVFFALRGTEPVGDLIAKPKVPYKEKITMGELEASEKFMALSKPERWVARFLVEHQKEQSK